MFSRGCSRRLEQGNQTECEVKESFNAQELDMFNFDGALCNEDIPSKLSSRAGERDFEIWLELDHGSYGE